jgi:flagellar biosynthetic protein FliO
MRWQSVAIGLVLAAAGQTPHEATAQNQDTPWPGQQVVYQTPLAPPPASGMAALQTSGSHALPGAPVPAENHPKSPELLPRKNGPHSASSYQASAKPIPKPGTLNSLVTVGASLVVVLGLFLIVAWLLRKASPAAAASLPKEVFEILGRAPLASRQQVHLVRCGRKLLLLSVTQAGIDTLAEIDDPAEVDRLAGLCVQAQPGSATAAFRQVFQQFTANATADEGRARPFGRVAEHTEIRHG